MKPKGKYKFCIQCGEKIETIFHTRYCSKKCWNEFKKKHSLSVSRERQATVFIKSPDFDFLTKKPTDEDIRLSPSLDNKNDVDEVQKDNVIVELRQDLDLVNNANQTLEKQLIILEKKLQDSTKGSSQSEERISHFNFTVPKVLNSGFISLGICIEYTSANNQALSVCLIS